MTNPKLPPILINKAGSVYYVYTYKNVWDRELKRSKRGESKKIGTILGGQKDGKIRFDEAFLISLKLRTVFAMVRTPILTGANSSLNTVRNAASN